MVEVEYNIYFTDKHKNSIIPSNLALYNDFHIICHSKLKNSLYLDSLTNIYKNYFSCFEYFHINHKIKLGIKIYTNNNKYKKFFFYNDKNINYNNIKFVYDNKFNPSYINLNYLNLSRDINQNNNDSHPLKKLFFSYPNCNCKYRIQESKNNWIFNNIYNNYFCFCLGENCLYQNIPQECKYKFYLNIIDKNRYLYNKTHYLLADFLYGNRAPGDAYLVFKEMIKQNISAHYVTERKEIFNQYNSSNNEDLIIIPINNNQYNITGDSLEKYLNLFLRLKAVISGAEFYSIYNIFYFIEYINFICLGHGVNYFKPFLYNDYYGINRYNTIILPSDKIIQIAKIYGWDDDNIIKIGLPRWDIFDQYSKNNKFLAEKENKSINKSIFIMFTWRALKKNKDISSYYFNNILKILNNIELNTALQNNNITIYISLHHNLLKNKDLFYSNNHIKYTKQEEILECLCNSSLILSDFSSVIFDFIYQYKPFIIYIPDSDDQNITNIYTQDYVDVINSLKNDSIYFENKFFSIKDTLKKIIYYINHNFKIEKKLKKFYDIFNFKGKNHINNLINYLK